MTDLAEGAPDTAQTVTIRRLGVRGDGVADGPIFVPGTLPGEVVQGTLVGDRIDKPSIVTPVADRVRAPCRHARTCGGCALQHASDAFVAGWKADMVAQELARVGIQAPFRPIATSPIRSRRRASLAGRRLKSSVTVGFHGRGSDTVVPVPDCLVLAPDLCAVQPALVEMTALVGSRRGEVTFHMTAGLTGVDVAAEGGSGGDPGLAQRLAEIAREADLARLSWHGEVIAARRPVMVAMGPAQVPLPPGAFLQATASGQAALSDAVTDALKGCRRVIDLFAGAGTFSLPLAIGAEVHAVEGAADHLAALDAGWRHCRTLKAVTTEVRDLFRNPLLAVDLARFDGAVIDPPRAGAAAQIQQLAASDLGRIAYVSCNPSTFARDLAVLKGSGFTLDWVQVVDQFRWSAHIELVASLSRDRR